MLKTILAISGKPGLYKFLSRGKNMIIIESIDAAKKRQPARSNDRIVALTDISIYTNDGNDVPLAQVLQNLKESYKGETIDIQAKKASEEEIRDVFAKALPNYDTDRVHVSDMRKVILWYNILIENGLNDFEIKEEEAAPEA